MKSCIRMPTMLHIILNNKCELPVRSITQYLIQKENIVYLDCQVEIPNEPGKITRFRKGKATYIRYAVGRIYNAEKKYNVPDHKTIGKLVSEDSAMMIPKDRKSVV